MRDYFKQLWRGERGLAETFWVWGVLVGGVAPELIAGLINNKFQSYDLNISFSYVANACYVLILVCVWRSTRRAGPIAQFFAQGYVVLVVVLTGYYIWEQNTLKMTKLQLVREMAFLDYETPMRDNGFDIVSFGVEGNSVQMTTFVDEEKTLDLAEFEHHTVNMYCEDAGLWERIIQSGYDVEYHYVYQDVDFILTINKGACGEAQTLTLDEWRVVHPPE